MDDIKWICKLFNPPEYILSLLIYGTLRHINGTDELADGSVSSEIQNVCCDLQYSRRVLRKLMQNYSILLDIFIYF